MTVGRGSFVTVVSDKDQDDSLQMISLCPDFTDKEMEAERWEVICSRPHIYRVAEFEPESRFLPFQLRLCLSPPRTSPNSSLRGRQSQHPSPLVVCSGLAGRAFVSTGFQLWEWNRQPPLVPGQSQGATA